MANTEKLFLTIARVDEKLFEGEVDSVTVPGSEGEMTLLANHEALISPLAEGTIAVRNDQNEDVYDIVSGTLEVSNNQATVLL